jgi:hypothetical protein
VQIIAYVGCLKYHRIGRHFYVIHNYIILLFLVHFLNFC